MQTLRTTTFPSYLFHRGPTSKELVLVILQEENYTRDVNALVGRGERKAMSEQGASGGGRYVMLSEEASVGR